jgi:glycosyltransferase involved in cell wall biosynthesis
VVSFSVIIVTHGREELLSKCLDSLRPRFDDWQLVLVANGKDLSKNILDKTSLISKNIVILKNDHQLSPGKARNLAIESCSSEWIFFLDDDAYVLPRYWEVLFPLLEETKIEVLGGPDKAPEGMNFIGQGLALALSSPLCSGSTFVRHKPLGKKLIEVNEEKLTSCNLWVRKSLLGSIKFPEHFKRAEETVLLQSLHSSGKKMFYHPKLVVAHHRREKVLETIKPSFLAGIYRSKSMKMNDQKSNSLFWLPAIFVLLHGFYFIDSFIFWYLARMYLGLILFMSLAITSKEKKINLLPTVIFFHYFIVFLYGLGFLFEKIGFRNGTK